MQDNWIPIWQVPKNGIISTLHSDGKEDVCKVIAGIIYSYDPKTDAPITHFKLRSDNPFMEKHKTMQNKTPLQTLISHIQEAIEANGKESKDDLLFAGQGLALTSVLIAAQNLEGVERTFVGKVWDAAQPDIEWSADGNEIERLRAPNKQEFLKSLYGEFAPYRVEWLDESPSVSNPSVLVEALEKIRGLHEAKGRKGCTWGDTDYDSLSAVAGYNDALGIAKEISDKALSQYNASLPGSRGAPDRVDVLANLIREATERRDKREISFDDYQETIKKHLSDFTQSTLPAQSGEPDTRQEEKE